MLDQIYPYTSAIITIIKDITTLSNIKDITTIVTLSIGSYVAWQGLRTWKTQLKGTQNYDLAKSTLINLNKYVESIYQVRNPAILGGEYPKPTDVEKFNIHQNEKQYKEKCYVYQNRYDKIYNIKPYLQENVIEIEVLWGEKLKNKFKQLFALEFKLFIEIIMYTESFKHKNDEYKDASSYDEKIINATIKNDSFRDEINKIRTEIENDIQPYLKL